MPLNYQPRRRNPIEDFLTGFQGSLGIAKTLQGMRESGEELGLKKQEVEQRGQAQKSLDEYRQQETVQGRMKSVTDLINAGQEEAAAQFFNNDPILQKYIGPNVGGKVTFDKKEELFKGANGFVGRYRRNAPPGTNPFEVLHDPTKILGPAEQLLKDAIEANKAGKLLPGFQSLEQQRNYALKGKIDPLLDLRQENLKGQIEERKARTQHLRQMMDIANDPKATLGQLSAYANALLRERDSIETPEEDKPEITNELRRIRKRMAEMGTNRPRTRPQGKAPSSGETGLPPGWGFVE